MPPIAAVRPRERDAPGQGPDFVLVLGHSNVDVQLQLKDLPRPGQSSPVLERRTVWGGTAANIALHAASLGAPTRLWSLVGPDFPAEWNTHLERAGVRLALDRVPASRTPTCFVLTDSLGAQSYCMDQGAMDLMTEHPPAPELLDSLAGTGWVHIATGDPLVYAAIASEARQRGHAVALDPGQEMRFRYDATSLRGLLGLSDCLFVNEEELRVACLLLGLSSADELLPHVATVVVTRGAKGASLYRRGQKALHANAFTVRPVDPTGAGDALRSGWYAALAQGLAMDVALRWGQAAAAVKVQHVGGQDHPVTRRELDAMLAQRADAS